jgi:hypothetical protein
MENEQKVVDYQAVLADLEAKRDELDNAIAVIKRVIGDPVAASATGPIKHHPSEVLTPTSFFAMSVGDAAKKYLSIVKQPKSTPEIAKALQEHGIKTVAKNFTVNVFSALQRKEIAGELVRPKRGLWGITEWYPGHRRSRENGEKRDASESAEKTEAKQKPTSTGSITAETFEQFVREKPRRMKEVTAHFGITKAAVKKLLEPASKVHIVGVGWLKVRE